MIQQSGTHSVFVAVSTSSDVKTVNIHTSMIYAHLHDKYRNRYISTTVDISDTHGGILP